VRKESDGKEPSVREGQRPKSKTVGVWGMYLPGSKMGTGEKAMPRANKESGGIIYKVNQGTGPHPTHRSKEKEKKGYRRRGGGILFGKVEYWLANRPGKERARKHKKGGGEREGDLREKGVFWEGKQNGHTLRINTDFPSERNCSEKREGAGEEQNPVNYFYKTDTRREKKGGGGSDDQFWKPKEHQIKKSIGNEA